MSFLTIDLGEEPPNCRSWGSKPRLICKMLDPKSGETVRIFTCLCGDVSKTARGPYQRNRFGQRQSGNAALYIANAWRKPAAR
jgi:hypothetical protein